MPMLRSTVAILLFASFFRSLDVMSFSSASTTPSLHLMPTAVPPFSTALTAYSTWKLRPSGEKTEFERSYPVPMDVYDSPSACYMASRKRIIVYAPWLRVCSVLDGRFRERLLLDYSSNFRYKRQ